MKHAVTLFLSTDTIDWIAIVARNLSRQRGVEVSQSDVVEYLSQRHWNKTITRIYDEKHLEYQAKLKGTKLIRGKAVMPKGAA